MISEECWNCRGKGVQAWQADQDSDQTKNAGLPTHKKDAARPRIVHLLTTARARVHGIPTVNIRRITVRTSIQKTRDDIRIIQETTTMKYNWYFDQGFTSQAVPCINRCDRRWIWSIPNLCRISTCIALILGSSTQFEPPYYELNLPESSQMLHCIKRYTEVQVPNAYLGILLLLRR